MCFVNKYNKSTAVEIPKKNNSLLKANLTRSILYVSGNNWHVNLKYFQARTTK